MTREEAIEELRKGRPQQWEWHRDIKVFDEAIDMAIEALKQEPCEDMGEVSDGYHTFNQLYHQRAVLFATIVNSHKDRAWKSFKHADGKYCFDRNGEWFIVGVDTPQGSYTYHYESKYWDIFDCKELQCGKEWDGHTEEDVTRLLSLQQDSILGKIRAEIDQKQYDFMDDKDYDEGIRFGLMLAYQIIDKYKAESEDKEKENEYQRQVEQYQYDTQYESTFNSETGSM